jgi:hypothetical protein
MSSIRIGFTVIGQSHRILGVGIGRHPLDGLAETRTVHRVAIAAWRPCNQPRAWFNDEARRQRNGSKPSQLLTPTAHRGVGLAHAVPARLIYHCEEQVLIQPVPLARYSHFESRRISSNLAGIPSGCFLTRRANG